jgi:RNA polymerase sigma-70 factor (ECF subfamily)
MVDHAAALRRFCCAHRRSEGDRQDLFQEIALALWRALPRFRGDSSERTWIYRIAQNVAFSEAVRYRRKQSREIPYDAIAPIGSDNNERRLDLLNAIQRLEPIERQLAWLYLEGLTGHEIGEVLGITEGNAAVRLTRLRQQLVRILNPVEAER